VSGFIEGVLWDSILGLFKKLKTDKIEEMGKGLYVPNVVKEPG